ncbi:MAG: 50S ribosomal protein L25 [Patescibacteria group bacterium]|nr:50S ribosomal protein L25 [Patescibacteria group bacterium]
MSLILNIKERDLTKKFPKPHKVESQTELLRGVFYGKKEKTVPISIPYVEFKKVWKKAGSSSLIVLKGVGEDKEAVIQDIDFDPVSERVRHVDFYVIERGKVMEADVTLEFVGNSPAVKELGGTLVKTLRELKIEVLPKDLPKMIEVDVSVLKDFDSRILAKDLIIPDSATLSGDPEEVVALVTKMEEEVEEEVVTPDIADVEVEQKGKKDEEDAEDKEA